MSHYVTLCHIMSHIFAHTKTLQNQNAMSSIALGRSTRSTRGKRLTAPTEDSGDEEFWNQQFFAEESEDDSFGGSDAEVEEDEFDADFFESETSSDEEEAEESRRGGDDDDDRKRKRGYVEPNRKKSAPKRAKVAEPEDDEQEEEASEQEDGEAAEAEPKPKVRAPKRAPLFDITVYEKRPQRAIAAENEKERLRRLAEADALRKPSAPRTKVEYREPTQAERLAEAVETERINAASLKELLTLEEEAKYKKERVVDTNPENAVPMIRYFSSQRRANPSEEIEAPTANTSSSKSKKSTASSSAPTSKVIFHRVAFFHPNGAEADTLPVCFDEATPPKPVTPAVCVITNQPAKYFDPLTQCPYATIDAFKQLRARYAQLISQHALTQAKKQQKSESNSRRA